MPPGWPSQSSRETWGQTGRFQICGYQLRAISLRVGIDGAVDHCDNLSHLTAGELSGQAVEEDGLGDDLNEVRLQKRRFRESRFAGLHSLAGRAFPAIAAKRDRENRIDPLGLVSRIDRNHDHGMFFVSEVDGPDFSTKRGHSLELSIEIDRGCQLVRCRRQFGLLAHGLLGQAVKVVRSCLL